MRTATHKFQNNRATSFYTPQTTRKSITSRHNFSQTKANFTSKLNKESAKLDLSLPLKVQQNPQIYFDKNKRKTFIKDLIDGYFKQSSSTLQWLDQPDINGSPLLQKSSIMRQNVYSSDCVKRNAKNHVQIKNPVKNKIIQLNISSLRDIDRLPTINEGQFPHRPNSDYRPHQKLEKRPSSPFGAFVVSSGINDSIFYDSNKSLFDSKIQLKQQEKDDSKASKLQLKIAAKKMRRFQSVDDQQLIREKLIKKIGLPVMWKSTTTETVLQYTFVKKTLRQMCYSIVQDKRGEEPLFLIFPTQYYHNLFVNNCEELVDIVKAMCKLVVKGKDQVSNNQIHMNNIHKIEEKNFQLYDWGSAAIRQTLTVQGIKYPTIYPPYSRKNEEWLLYPEYISPQLLRAIEYGSYEHLWAQKGGVGSCDVWSIGCLLFELITLIPISQAHHCLVKGKHYSRRGLMGTKIKTVQNIIAKQKYFRSLAMRRIKDMMREKDAPSVNVKLLHLLPQMLEQDPSKRISASQILSILS